MCHPDQVICINPALYPCLSKSFSVNAIVGTYFNTIVELYPSLPIAIGWAEKISKEKEGESWK